MTHLIGILDHFSIIPRWPPLLLKKHELGDNWVSFAFLFDTTTLLKLLFVFDRS